MIFWINVPLGIASLALLLPKMDKIPVFHRKRKVDWLGGVLLMASAVVFMLVLTWGGNRFLWLSPTIAAMIGAAAMLALGFVWHARRADEPFLPLPLMGGRVVPYGIAAGSCALGAMVGLTVHMPLYYEVVYRLTSSEAGFALIPLAAISTGGAALAGRTMARMKHYKRVAIIGGRREPGPGGGAGWPEQTGRPRVFAARRAESAGDLGYGPLAKSYCPDRRVPRCPGCTRKRCSASLSSPCCIEGCG